MLYIENTEQQGNGSAWSNGTIHFDQTGPTLKIGLPQKVNRFFGNFSGWTEPVHSVLRPNLRKFWLNGSRPLCTQYYNYTKWTTILESLG